MAGQIALWQLLDHALGNPNQSTVDFGLLKDFLIQFLTATNKAEFIVNAKGNPNGLPQDNQDTTNVDEETESKRVDVQVEGSVDNEKITDDNQKNDGRIAQLEMQQANLRKNHDDILHRLTKIEQDTSTFYTSLQPLERLPSGAELLSNRKSMVTSKGMADNNENRPATNREGSIANEGGENGENYLSGSWNTVRVNKRLQALEDGVDKLFAMLDIITAGQNELRSRKEKKTVDNGDLSKLKEDINQLRKGGNDQSGLDLMKGDIDKQLSSMNERLRGIESMLSRLDELEAKLGAAFESNSSLHKKLNDLEARHNAGNTNADGASNIQERRDEEDESALKNALLDIENLKNKNRRDEFENIARTIAEDLNKVRETLAGFVVRQEIEDMVRWPQLEDALNVRGFVKGRDGVDGSSRDANQNVVDVEEIEADARPGNEEDANEKKEDEDNAKESKESITVADVSGDDVKEPNATSHPSPEMIECLQRISDLASTFGAFESRFNATIAGNDSREESIEELKKDVQVLNDLTSTINQLADNNKSLVDQTRADLNQFMQEFYGRADGNEEELNGIKEHLIELENMGGRTSLALNDLSSGIYSELRAKQKLIDALYECVDGLQRNKVDIGNAKSIFDLDAYKNALDSKVSMNDFDEMMMALNANLQDVLQKLDKFSSEEESLKDALDKLSSNMKDKLDAKAEESLKKYLESRIAQLQKSRENLVSTAGRDMITNAAGFRRPLSTLFHCISCNRPVHLDGHEGYNSMSYRRRGNGNRELAKTDSTSRTSLNALQGDRKSKQDLSRAFMQNPRKQLKGATYQRDSELPGNTRELLEQRRKERTIVNYLLGTDGQVYRGRYKMTDLRHPQFQSENEVRLRTRSAEVGRSATADQRHVNETMSNPVSLASTPRSLPPIGQEVLGVKTSQIRDRYDFPQGKPHSGNDGSKL